MSTPLIAAGTRIGPYEVLGRLGAGGMGQVYRARDTRLAREVALKVLPAETTSPARRERFEKEARSASALNHPNIVAVYDVGSSGPFDYIAMERVDGKTLREVLFAGALPVRKALALAAPLAEGVARAHEAGILHRDLKPENVMVTRDGVVKILDFGLAKVAEAADDGSPLPTATATAPGTVLGTVGYMSPEQATGHPADFRSDQFSLGAILYEMLAGKPAFHGATSVDILSEVLHRDPVPLGTVEPAIPVPVRWVIERCLSKDPAGRYASSSDLARDLVQLKDRAAELDVPAFPRRPRRGGWIAAIVLALAAAAAALRLGRTVPSANPSLRFRQLTFADETIYSARFAPDGETVLYGRLRGDTLDLLSTRIGSLESRPFPVHADVLSVSRTGEMAVRLGGADNVGPLARMPLTGVAEPRRVLDGVRWAAWTADGGDLAIVRPMNGKQRLEFPVGRVISEARGFIGQPKFSRDGRRILFSNETALLVADLASQRVRALGDIPRMHGYAWAPGADEVWYLRNVGGSEEIRAVGLRGGAGRLLTVLPGGWGLQDAAPDGRMLLERAAARVTMRARARPDAGELSLAWLDASSPVDITPDGSAVLFTENGAALGGVDAVFLRRTDGSDAMRLGEGFALALSPDAKWAIARRDLTAVIPTSGGELRLISAPKIKFHDGATFFPDGTRVLLTGSEGDAPSRLYGCSLGGGSCEPLTSAGVSLPEGTHTVSPDAGRVAAIGPDGAWQVLRLGSESPGHPVAGLRPDERPVRWTADGRSLFVLAETGEMSRLDPVSGRRESYRAFPAQAAAIPTADGGGYVYGYGDNFSHLFLLEGLR